MCARTHTHGAIMNISIEMQCATHQHSVCVCAIKRASKSDKRVCLMEFKESTVAQKKNSDAREIALLEEQHTHMYIRYSEIETTNLLCRMYILNIYVHRIDFTQSTKSTAAAAAASQRR